MVMVLVQFKEFLLCLSRASFIQIMQDELRFLKNHYNSVLFSLVFQIKLPGTSSESFLAFLEYLYTDHSPIEETDSVGLLVLADEYGQKRLLNLCELYITKEVDKHVAKNIEKSDIDVIGLLLTSQVRG